MLFMAALKSFNTVETPSLVRASPCIIHDGFESSTLNFKFVLVFPEPTPDTHFSPKPTLRLKTSDTGCDGLAIAMARHMPQKTPGSQGSFSGAFPTGNSES